MRLAVLLVVVFAAAVVSAQDFSAAEIKAIVDRHNHFRDSVSPKAAKALPHIAWDAEIAAFSKKYAVKCITDASKTMVTHNPTRYLDNGDYVGENIYAGSAG